MFATFPCKSRGMCRHCVSRPLLGMYGRFLNNCRNFHADCVSHRGPVKSGARSLARRPSRHPQAHPLRAIVLSVDVPPTRARPPVALSLTRFRAAHALTITSPRMRAEPATADATRTGAVHPVALPRPLPPTSIHACQFRPGLILASRPGSFLASAEALPQAQEGAILSAPLGARLTGYASALRERGVIESTRPPFRCRARGLEPRASVPVSRSP